MTTVTVRPLEVARDALTRMRSEIELSLTMAPAKMDSAAHDRVARDVEQTHADQLTARRDALTAVVSLLESLDEPNSRYESLLPSYADNWHDAWLPCFIPGAWR